MFAVPLIVRLAVWFELRGFPMFDSLFIDARTYHDMASRLASGLPLPPGPHWQPPLFPYFLSWIYAVTGPDPDGGRIAQVLLGSASCVLLFALADRVAGRRAAWIAWGAMSLYGPFLYFDLQLLNVTLGTFLFLAFLVTALPLVGRPFARARTFAGMREGAEGRTIKGAREAREQRPGSSPAGRGFAWNRGLRAFGAGFLAGAGAITIGNMMLLAPVAAGWIWLRERRRRGIVTGILLLAGATIPIGAVTLWNLSASGEPVIVSYNGGVNFWIGNNPDYESTVAIRPGREWIALTAEPREAGHLGYRAQSAYFFDKAFDWIKGDPRAALELLAHKTRLFFRADEILRNQQIYPFREESVILSLLLWIHGIGFPFGVVLPLAAVGVLSVMVGRLGHSPSGNGGLGFLLLITVVYAVSVIAFFVTARYRAPIVPLLLIFAAMAVEAIRTAAISLAGSRRAVPAPERSRAWRRVALSATLVVAAVIANAGLPPMPAEFNSDAHSDLGYTYQVQGDRAAARREYERALELDPRNFEARNNLAGLLSEAGDWTPAVLQLRAILAEYPEDRKALANIGRIYLTMGRPYDAGASFDRLARLDPADPIASAGLQSAHEMADRVEADEMAANPERFLESVRKAAAESPHDRFLQARLQGLLDRTPAR